MSNEQTWFDRAVLGLAMVAVGCADDKGNNEDDETGSEDVGDGDTGDGDGDTGEPVPNDIPLELELARFNKNGKFLLLRFSEPMAAVDAVDPADFRVSLATTWRYVGYYGYVYQSSNYRDPSLYLGSYCYYGGCSLPLVPELVANGNKETDIVVRFLDPLEPDACANFVQLQADYQEFDSQPNTDARIALFPHYSPGAIKVKSADGEVLEAIGPEWVEVPSMYMYEYEFGWPSLDPQIEIPCTVGIDP
jgi:hypothetical protein